jgi:uncharacterized protein
MTDFNKNQDIFSGLEHLGFDNINNIKIFKDKNIEDNMDCTDTLQQNEQEKQKSLLYDREICCPVCGNNFKARSVKTSAARVVKKDSDFFIRHDVINPYFYDVWLCNICGYASMKIDFEKVRSHQIEKIKQGISFKWKGRQYPEIYDLNIAIERYKLSLLNYCVMEAKSSSKAMNCLKLAWMYRLEEDFQKESVFLGQALEGFSDAYYNEDFPLYGLDRFSTMYLIGELNRRIGNYEQSMVWFSKVITTPSVPQKLKDLARDQKDLIKDDLSQSSESATEMRSEKPSKRGLFSKLFK